MKRRVVPNTISKRFRRKLRRSKAPFLLWLRCKRPAVWRRLSRLWVWRFMDHITNISPCDTPFWTRGPKIEHGELLEQWKVDLV